MRNRGYGSFCFAMPRHFFSTFFRANFYEHFDYRSKLIIAASALYITLPLLRIDENISEENSHIIPIVYGLNLGIDQDNSQYYQALDQLYQNQVRLMMYSGVKVLLHTLNVAGFAYLIYRSARWAIFENSKFYAARQTEEVTDMASLFYQKHLWVATSLVSTLKIASSATLLIWQLRDLYSIMNFSEVGIDLRIDAHCFEKIMLMIVIANFAATAVFSWLEQYIDRHFLLCQNDVVEDVRYALGNSQRIAVAGNLNDALTPIGQSSFKLLSSYWLMVFLPEISNLLTNSLISNYFIDYKFQSHLAQLVALGIMDVTQAQTLKTDALYASNNFNGLISAIFQFIKFASMLEVFEKYLDIAHKYSKKPNGYTFDLSNEVLLAFKGVQLEIDDHTMRNIPDIRVQAGEYLCLSAPTGYGKSTLIDAICGIWKDGRGHISRCESIIRLPQKTVFRELGCLYDTIMRVTRYPQIESLELNQEIKLLMSGLICDYGLNHVLPGILDQKKSVIHRLSGGEEQRLAIISMLLELWVFSRSGHASPVLMILDEATSAMDTKTANIVEKSLLNVVSGKVFCEVDGVSFALADEVKCGIIQVSHRESHRNFNRRIELG